MIDRVVREKMAELLAEWLFKDFELLLEEPTTEDIEEVLEEH